MVFFQYFERNQDVDFVDFRGGVTRVGSKKTDIALLAKIKRILNQKSLQFNHKSTTARGLGHSTLKAKISAPIEGMLFESQSGYIAKLTLCLQQNGARQHRSAFI